MNYKVIGYYLGQILKIISAFLLLPVFVALIYGEFSYLWCFAVVIAIYLGLGLLLPLPAKKLKSKKLRSKEGLVIVGLSWVVISLIGALPFTLGGVIPNYINALFETISGFTTTGATILDAPEALPYCMLFWRAFTHWLGGMGILVFILAIIPGTEGSTFQLLKFESPGPQVGKLTSKVRHTATILYLFYLVFTVLEMILLLFSGIGVFDSVTLALSTAGTGGFANTGASIAEFNNLYVEIVIMVFMFIFSLNFNIYYLLLLRHFKVAFLDEELRFYVIYVFLAIGSIVVNLTTVLNFTVGEALRYSSFSVLALTSSTGFATYDFTTWPAFSQGVLVVCMFVGACAGSTGGGLKTSRFIILVKSAMAHLMSVISPRSVQVIKMNGKALGVEEADGVTKYFLVYVLIFIVALFFISMDGKGLTQSFSSVLSCINNDGPYLAGAFEGYNSFSYLSKIVFMFLMLIGRLEIFPILLLCVPKTWRRNY